MTKFTLNISFDDEEEHLLFKKCVRKLLESTFILRDKNENLYLFLSRESNRQKVADYFKASGFELFVDSRLQFIMLKQDDNDEETVGLRKANLYRFSNEEYHIIIVLWSIYLEKLGNEEVVAAPRGEIIDKIKMYNVAIDSRKFNNAFATLKKFNLIDYEDDTKNDEFSMIKLYPSLQFCWDIPSFKVVAEEHILKLNAVPINSENSVLEDDLYSNDMNDSDDDYDMEEA